MEPATFAVKCVNCFKWRLIPTKEKYEEIRELVERPFSCEIAREWRPDISCDDDPDIEQNESRKNWAMDKPGIPRAPPGWQRILKIRTEGGYNFADVFYDPPTGKLLRSMREVRKYLRKHPAKGVNISRFSFTIPSPLQEDYVKKRSRLPPPSYDEDTNYDEETDYDESSGSEVYEDIDYSESSGSEVDEDTDYSKSSGSEPESPPMRKKGKK